MYCCSDNKCLIPETITLTEVSRKQIDDYCVFDCALVDTLLVIQNGCANKWMSIYSTNNLSHIADFGVKGNLPGELLMPQIVKDANMNSSNFMIGDTNLGILYRLNLNDILNSSSESVIVQNSGKKLPNDMLLAVNMSMVSQEQSAYISIKDKDDFFHIQNIIDNNKNVIKVSPNYTYSDINQKIIAYTGSMYANSNKEVVAIAFKHLDMVNFYTKDGELINSTKISKTVKPIITEEFATELIIHNNLIYGTTKYLYVQKLDATMPDIMDGKITNNKILKFDWNGNLLNVYQIPLNITTFCIDENSNKIYTISKSTNIGYAEIVEFEMM